MKNIKWISERDGSLIKLTANFQVGGVDKVIHGTAACVSDVESVKAQMREAIARAR